MPFINDFFAGKWRQKWVNPPADERYGNAVTAGYGVAVAGGVEYAEGVPGLSSGRWFGAVSSPWLGVVPNSYLSPAYAPDTSVIGRGAPAATGQGAGTPINRGAPAGAGIEIAPGEFI